MKRHPTTSKPQWPRLVSEFFVIVLGVLVALGVDSWASSSSDRRLEREYLGRLLEDVTYDVEELEFIRAVSASGLAYTDTLLSGRGLEFDGDRLVGSALIASNARVPDLSRNTFQELVASGRIGLFRSTTVRLALARYDRAVTEQLGFWAGLPYDFSHWVSARIPHEQQARFREACADTPDPIWQKTPIACPFDLGEWSTDGLRHDLESDEAKRLITLYSSRHGVSIEIVAGLRIEAETLKQVLEKASGGRPAR